MAPQQKPLSELNLEDIDFEVVKDCTDRRYLKRYIKLLEDDGGYFADLLNACKSRLLQVAPKEYYLLYPRFASDQEVAEAKQDLLDWENAVKATDAALRDASNNNKSNLSGTVAPVRGQDLVTERPNQQTKMALSDIPKSINSAKNTYARDKTTMKDYYSAWDTLDVDKIEEEMEKEETEAEEAKRRHFDELREKQEDAHITTPIEVEQLPGHVAQAHQKHLADAEKEKGNEAFYSKDFEEADAYYSRSIQLRPDDPATWANRALARLRLARPGDALQDCEHALALNPRYMKALHRRGKALYELQRFEEAVRCFHQALAESPGNAQINGDLMLAKRKVRNACLDPCDVTCQPTCRIEELSDEANIALPAIATGYTRVQIEQDSASEDEMEAIHVDEMAFEVGQKTQNIAPQPTVAVGPYRKVAIQEVSDSDEEVEPKQSKMCFDDMD